MCRSGFVVLDGILSVADRELMAKVARLLSLVGCSQRNERLFLLRG